jgi:hypothetical protein
MVRQAWIVAGLRHTGTWSWLAGADRSPMSGSPNILKHAPGALVQIEIRDAGDELAVSVCDEGPGISTDGGTTSPQVPTGLTTMRERVAAVGGSIVLESAPGRGRHSGSRPHMTAARWPPAAWGCPVRRPPRHHVSAS